MQRVRTGGIYSGELIGMDGRSILGCCFGMDVGWHFGITAGDRHGLWDEGFWVNTRSYFGTGGGCRTMDWMGLSGFLSRVFWLGG